MLSCGRFRPHRCLLAGAAAAIAALVFCVPESVAGVYHVFSCRVPYGAQAGDVAPVETAAGGGEEAGKWSKIASGSGAAAINSCGTPEGALVASLSAGREHSKVDDGEWTFTSPAGESIVSGTRLWRAGNADGGSGYGFWFSSPEDLFSAPDQFGPSCVYTAGCHAGIGSTSVFLSSENQVEVSTENVPSTHLYINASCSSSSCPSDTGDEQGHAVVVYIYATDIALEEQTTPTVSDLSGELDNSEPLSGTASLFFQASDSGSGVYKEIVSVDGEVLSSQIVDETTLCKEVPSVPAEDGPAFLSAQPCPSTANGRVSLDTTKLSNGAHHLLVEVTDAAGNATAVLSKTIEVANGSAQNAGSSQQSTPSTAVVELSGSLPNGTPPSEHPTLSVQWAHARGTTLTGPFDKAQTITGRLTGPSGSPIADATIDLAARKSYGGAPSIALGSATTNAQGEFSFRLSKQSPSQRIALSYSPTLGGEPVISQTLALRVPAAVKLNVTPGSVGAGETIRLQGRILGTPIPPGGKQVVLEARSKGSSWLQFLVLRSGRSGRFEGTHRFRLPGPVRYFFRAVCPAEADFPFATGRSNQVTVWER
jgi:hypothetical protein